MAPTEKQDELQGIALSLEGSKLTYVTPIGDDIEYKEMLIVRYDHVSGLHFVQWAGQASLQTECAVQIIKDHPNVVIASCPSDDALWTVEAQNMWAGLRDQDGGRIQRRASIKAKEKLAQESEEEAAYGKGHWGLWLWLISESVLVVVVDGCGAGGW